VQYLFLEVKSIVGTVTYEELLGAAEDMVWEAFRAALPTD
jgi:hypothetical protein